MESSILVYCVTMSWMFLAYSNNSKIIKEYLHLVVAFNMISIVYLIVAVNGSFNFDNYITAGQIYLSGNLIAFIVFIFLYLLEWSIKYLKYKNNKNKNLMKDD